MQHTQKTKKRKVTPPSSPPADASPTSPHAPTDSHIQEPLTFGAEASSAAHLGTRSSVSSSSSSDASSSSAHQEDQGSPMKTDEKSSSWKDLFKFKKRNSPDSK